MPEIPNPDQPELELVYGEGEDTIDVDDLERLRAEREEEIEASTSRHPANEERIGPNGFPMRLIAGEWIETRPDLDDGPSDERMSYRNPKVEQESPPASKQPKPRVYELPGRAKGRQSDHSSPPTAEQFRDGRTDQEFSEDAEKFKKGWEYAQHINQVRKELEASYGPGLSEDQIMQVADYLWHNPLDES